MINSFFYLVLVIASSGPGRPLSTIITPVSMLHETCLQSGEAAVTDLRAKFPWYTIHFSCVRAN